MERKDTNPGNDSADRSNGSPDLTLSDGDYRRLCEFAYRLTGVVLGDGKKEMLLARLGRRVRAVKLSSLHEYVQHIIENPQSPEVVRFIGAITTHKTEFFRESHHFDFLKKRWAPAMLDRARKGLGRKIRIWSAACSTGEEPYTLAMVLRDAFGEHLPGLDLKILASDVDVGVLAQAQRGIYLVEHVRPVPQDFQQKYFLKGVDANAGLMQVKPQLQSMIVFQRINLLDEKWPIKSRLDLIMCRNVLIYFDAATRLRLVKHFHSQLAEGGHLIIGHSENIADAGDAFERVGQTIYRKTVKHGSRRPKLTTNPDGTPILPDSPSHDTPTISHDRDDRTDSE